MKAIAKPASKGSSTGSVSGLLLVGHGTRDNTGIAEFLSVAQQVTQQCPDVPVEACFLEIAEPTIAAGVAALVRRGVKQITVSPVLLFAAGHAKLDIPAAVEAAIANSSPSGRGQGEGAAHSSPKLSAEKEIEVNYAPALESHPAIVKLSARRYDEALQGLPAAAPSDTLLLFVGRGSRDDTATAEMHRFAQLRAAKAPVGRVEVCFVAMAEPSFAAMLPRVAELPFRRIVVQPHLLFAGELLAELRSAVTNAAKTWSTHQWIFTERLGPDPLVAQALRELSNRPAVRSVGPNAV